MEVELRSKRSRRKEGSCLSRDEKKGSIVHEKQGIMVRCWRRMRKQRVIYCEE